MSEWEATVDPADDRPVDPAEEAALTLPEQLDAPLEAAEADVVDQAIEVPADDDE